VNVPAANIPISATHDPQAEHLRSSGVMHGWDEEKHVDELFVEHYFAQAAVVRFRTLYLRMDMIDR